MYICQCSPLSLPSLCVCSYGRQILPVPRRSHGSSMVSTSHSFYRTHCTNSPQNPYYASPTYLTTSSTPSNHFRFIFNRATTGSHHAFSLSRNSTFYDYINSCFNVVKDESSNIEEEDNAIKEKERRRRLNRINGRTRWHSYSPSNQNQYRNQRCYVSVPRIQRTMSCKSLWELEFEEVKGFMDLGFTFKKGNLCPRMISLLPGLQRINRQKKEQENSESDEASKDDVDQYIEDEEDNEVNKGVMRPYLSEAWLINRPDSPLLNLRMPRVSKDMKSHLKFWARTVASVIQQES